MEQQTKEDKKKHVIWEGRMNKLEFRMVCTNDWDFLKEKRRGAINQHGGIEKWKNGKLLLTLKARGDSDNARQGKKTSNEKLLPLPKEQNAKRYAGKRRGKEQKKREQTRKISSLTHSLRVILLEQPPALFPPVPSSGLVITNTIKPSKPTATRPLLSRFQSLECFHFLENMFE
jgi:hypothetical protein